MPYDVVQTSAADTLPPVRRFDFLEAALPQHGDGKRHASISWREAVVRLSSFCRAGRKAGMRGAT
jgi:hypothetical protein